MITSTLIYPDTLTHLNQIDPVKTWSYSLKDLMSIIGFTKKEIQHFRKLVTPETIPFEYFEGTIIEIQDEPFYKRHELKFLMLEDYINSLDSHKDDSHCDLEFTLY